ncbi:glucose-6-phosphate isomerase [Bacillota bacterium LX-D]|nr:glucose-6-phosphate isomerase [Bacillota bacterium LX-D]
MSQQIAIDYSKTSAFMYPHELEFLAPQIRTAHEMLHNKTCPGKEYVDWLDWPLNYDRDELERIKYTSLKIKEKAEVFIVIGIGGSYLGAKAGIEALQHRFYNQLPIEERQAPEIYFVGNNLSSTYINHLLKIIAEKDIIVNVISKSGTTLEPAIAFRIFRKILEERYGKEGARERIIATTDKEKGLLKRMAQQEGYATFVVPDGVGGRYSVLTPVGLLPLAVAQINVEQLLEGAQQGYQLYNNSNLLDNPCYQYAGLRFILYQKGKTLELLANYEPSLQYFAEWWKQLFGESEGKDHKGIFPASVNLTTDLHSLGQYMQDGLRNLFITTLWVQEHQIDLTIPKLDDNLDELDYLCNQSLHEINYKAAQGTMEAHTHGGVPNIKINLPKLNPYFLGQLIYFFEKACAISGSLLGVNPYDQPGVEAYKKNMFRLLGKK